MFIILDCMVLCCSDYVVFYCAVWFLHTLTIQVSVRARTSMQAPGGEDDAEPRPQGSSGL